MVQQRIDSSSVVREIGGTKSYRLAFKAIKRREERNILHRGHNLHRCFRLLHCERYRLWTLQFVMVDVYENKSAALTAHDVVSDLAFPLAKLPLVVCMGALTSEESVDWLEQSSIVYLQELAHERVYAAWTWLGKEKERVGRDRVVRMHKTRERANVNGT